MRSLRARGPLARRSAAVLLLALGFGLQSPGRGAAEPVFLPLEEEGAWTRSDRQVHFAASLAIAASLRVEGRSRAVSIGGTALVGVAKEVYDVTLKPRRLAGRGVSRKDLAADLLGALAGVLIVAAMDR